MAVGKQGDQVLDHQDHLIDIEDLEEAAYLFALEFRTTGEMHVGDVQGHLIETFVVTPEKLEKMGLPKDSLPQGWWVGFHIPDASVYKKVKDGLYKMFSIQGTAVAEEVE